MADYNPDQNISDIFVHGIPFIMEGQVVDTSDPDQMGRVRVWIPALDGENYDIAQLVWADYAPMLAGFTVEYPHGAGEIKNDSHSAYGFWGVPKVGATVYVFFLNGNPDNRVYFASSIRLHRNRSLPAGRNVDTKGRIGPWGDAGDADGNLNPIQPAYDNARAQFQDKLDAPEAQSRGAYERQVAQPKFDKDGTEGYSPNAADPTYLDPQTYCFVSPGGHSIIMQDDPRFARLRVKTGEGHQIILDDANERIYVSTARGASWFEMDLDGHVNVFGLDSMSFRSGKDINFFADNNINLEAGQGINLKANAADVRLQAQGSFHAKANVAMNLSACKNMNLEAEEGALLTAKTLDVSVSSSLKISGGADAHLKAAGNLIIQAASAGFNGGSSLKLSASRIDLNGGSAGSAATAVTAECPELPASPTVVPGFEPWTRPESTAKRNPNWKK